MLTGPLRKPLSGTPKQLVVLLHGWGADGANLIDLADVFATALPDAQFIAPDAPEPCEANPFGFQWFSLMDRNPAALAEGVDGAAATLSVFLEAQLAELKLKPAQLALVGFSQGTMLALHLALRWPEQIACVVGFSGALLAEDTLASHIRSRPPVCLIHGQQDEVVPFAAMSKAKAALEAAGVLVETQARPGMGHSIDMQGIEIAKRALKHALIAA